MSRKRKETRPHAAWAAGTIPWTPEGLDGAFEFLCALESSPVATDRPPLQEVDIRERDGSIATITFDRGNWVFQLGDYIRGLPLKDWEFDAHDWRVHCALAFLHRESAALAERGLVADDGRRRTLDDRLLQVLATAPYTGRVVEDGVEECRFEIADVLARVDALRGDKTQIR